MPRWCTCDRTEPLSHVQECSPCRSRRTRAPTCRALHPWRQEIVCLHSEAAIADSHVVSVPSVAVGFRHGGGAAAVLDAATARAKAGASDVAVLVSFGHARWGRTQLQNEALRGDWVSSSHRSITAQLTRHTALDTAALTMFPPRWRCHAGSLAGRQRGSRVRGRAQAGRAHARDDHGTRGDAEDPAARVNTAADSARLRWRAGALTPFTFRERGAAGREPAPRPRPRPLVRTFVQRTCTCACM